MSSRGIYKLQMDFSAVDHFTETLRAWDLECWQFEPGVFRAELSQIGVGEFLAIALMATTRNCLSGGRSAATIWRGNALGLKHRATNRRPTDAFKVEPWNCVASAF